jgi:hypothetical protein
MACLYNELNALKIAFVSNVIIPVTQHSKSRVEETGFHLIPCQHNIPWLSFQRLTRNNSALLQVSLPVLGSFGLVTVSRVSLCVDVCHPSSINTPRRCRTQSTLIASSGQFIISGPVCLFAGQRRLLRFNSVTRAISLHEFWHYLYGLVTYKYDNRLHLYQHESRQIYGCKFL